MAEEKCFAKDTKLRMILQNVKQYGALKILSSYSHDEYGKWWIRTITREN